MRKKEYRRWDYNDETEMSMEEQLTLEDHQFDYDHGSDTPTTTSTTTTFSQPNVTLMGTHTQRKKGHRRVRIKEKVRPSCGVVSSCFISVSRFLKQVEILVWNVLIDTIRSQKGIPHKFHINGLPARVNSKRVDWNTKEKIGDCITWTVIPSELLLLLTPRIGIQFAFLLHY